MPTVEPLIEIEGRITALEVMIRTLERTDDQQARFLELHSRPILGNIAGALHSIRDELSGYLYRNAPPTEDCPGE